jgi:hypothetical protein
MGTTGLIRFPDGTVAECVADAYPDYVGPLLKAWLEDVVLANGVTFDNMADDFVDATEETRRKEYPKEITLGRLTNGVVSGTTTTVIDYQAVVFSRDAQGHRLEPVDQRVYNYTYTVTEDGRVFAGPEL